MGFNFGPKLALKEALTIIFLYIVDEDREVIFLYKKASIIHGISQ
jgi:hypothetical protein